MPPTAPTVLLPNVRDGLNQPHAYEDYRVALAQLAPANRVQPLERKPAPKKSPRKRAG